MAAVVGVHCGLAHRDSRRQLASDRLGDELRARARAAEGRFGLDPDVAALLALARGALAFASTSAVGHLDAELRAAARIDAWSTSKPSAIFSTRLYAGGVLGREGLSLAVGFLVEVLDRQLEVLLGDLVAGDGLDGLVAAAGAADDCDDHSGEDGDASTDATMSDVSQRRIVPQPLCRSRRGMLAAMRATLIINPFASGVTEEGLAAVERELRPSVELTVALTKRPRHATELARGVDGADRIYVFGGDGLLERGAERARRGRGGRNSSRAAGRTSWRGRSAYRSILPPRRGRSSRRPYAGSRWGG